MALGIVSTRDEELTRIRVQELHELRNVPYSVWEPVVGKTMTKEIAAGSGTRYRVYLRADWVATGAREIRVTLRIAPMTWRRRPETVESFIITPESRILGSR